MVVVLYDLFERLLLVVAWSLQLLLVDDLVTEEVAVLGRARQELWRSVLTVGVIAAMSQLGGHRQTLGTEQSIGHLRYFN